LVVDNEALVLLLFDIDGTLLQKASREHVSAMHAALQRVYGLTRPARVEAAGRTDLDIARNIALLAGIPAVSFDDGMGDLTSEMAVGFPTSAVAVFEFDGGWADMTEGECRLVGFSVPRG